MRTLVGMLFFLGFSYAISAQVQVDLITKDGDDLGHMTAIEVSDSLGYQMVKKEFQSEKLIIDLVDSIQGEIQIRITAMGYFPIEFKVKKQRKSDSILISNVLLVPSLRRKLPRNATCGTYAPRKRDIPKKIYISINGIEAILVPDKDDVVGITYVRK